MSESKVLFILVTVAVLSSVLQKQYMLQSAVSSCVVGCVEKVLPLSTVKQGILYWTCTGLVVKVIGLAPTRD